MIFNPLRETDELINQKFISVTKLNNTCFGAYLNSMGTQHRNLHQSSGTASRLTYFILQVHTGTELSSNSGQVFDKMQVDGLEV